MSKQTYTIHVADDGSGEDFEVEAADLADAQKQAADLRREWVAGGDFGPQGSVHVRSTISDANGTELDSDSDDIDIETDHEQLIRDAGGDTDCAHEWTSEGEGGMTENPGVWSIGGAAILIREHCTRCGLIRETISGDVNRPVNRNGVTYSVAHTA